MAQPEIARVAPAERRERVLAAAREVFVAAGLKGARTKDIADRAGVAEGLLFKYFGTKEQLFDAAILEPLQDIVIGIADAARTFGDLAPEDRLHRSHSFHETMQHTMLEIAPLLGTALFSDQARGEAFYAEHILPLISESSRGLEETLHAWPHAPIDARFLFLVFWGTHLAIALDAHFGGADVDVAAIGRQFTALMNEQLSPQPTGPAKPRRRRPR
jgi:TetR/AcrR family transcriptional regulator